MERITQFFTVNSYNSLSVFLQGSRNIRLIDFSIAINLENLRKWITYQCPIDWRLSAIPALSYSSISGLP